MHDPERQALSRAAAILLTISVARWAVEVTTAVPQAERTGAGVLAEHIAATDSAAAEEDRRGRPLQEGERIDPNSAPEVELDRLPGVGPATAAAILAARDSGAIFGVAEDLLVVRGIGPTTLERLRPWLDLSGRPYRRSRAAQAGAGGRIDVNRADVETLQRLPGVGPALARRIVEERSNRPFASVDDLRRVRGIGPATVERLRVAATAGAKR